MSCRYGKARILLVMGYVSALLVKKGLDSDFCLGHISVVLLRKSHLLFELDTCLHRIVRILLERDSDDVAF